MRKLIAIDRRAGTIVSLAAAALTGASASLAGPGCMGNKQPMGAGYYPPAPMGPHPAYGAPHPYAGAPMPYRGMMAGPYPRPMPAQWGTPARAAGPTHAQTGTRQQAAQPTSAASSGENEGSGEIITVHIDGMRFEPATITVKPGTTVTWVQGSSMPHTVTGEAGGPRSSALYSGQTYSHTFDTAGRYDYACEFHPGMKGSVLVEGDGRET